ncbi:hypothetical protein BJ170DRAFT_718988, partial [Xylariales sp. AK1849]
ELARQRDLHKYYQPWLDSQSFKAVPPNTNPDSTSQAIRGSPDSTLTALAQLAALRLNVKRGMVSLLDTHAQIILAEATRTLSLVDQTRHAPGDHLWLGNVSLPRQDCMDEHVFGATTICKDTEGQHVECSALVVNDTLEDDRFKSRSYVSSGSTVRFYAGVPIVTKQGYSIGVYAVSDTQPRRQGLTLDEVQFMEDVAQIVVEHLDKTVDAVGRVSERNFFKGISYFLEDLSEFKYKGRQILTDLTASSTSNTISSPSNIYRHDQGDSGSRPRFSRNNSSWDQGNTESYNGIRRIFTEASQLLCEQSQATACLFAGAVNGLFSDQPEQGISPAALVESGMNLDMDFELIDDDRPTVQETTEDTTSASEHAGTVPQATTGDPSDEAADILGIALAEGNGGDCFRQGMITWKALERCILRYPFGKCFHIRKGRVVSNPNSDPDETNYRVPDVSPRHGNEEPGTWLPREVLQHLSDARWLLFLPLFNYAQGQWVAAGFIWGNDFKMGDPNDVMPYFKTFGSCMMSELASMEVLNTDIAKSTFIASISHDLRTPLHGILGSIEFLEDTLTSAYQMSLIGVVETCSKTLLDTIDHVLDYAKINDLNSVGSPHPQIKGGKLSKETGDIAVPDNMASLTTSFDLALLLEEVVESVFAGQTFRKINLRQHNAVNEMNAQMQELSKNDSATVEEQIHAGSAKFSGKVYFILNIQKATSWFFRGQTGALRRVIMNVVGNAIKYCNTGSIEVSMSTTQITSSDAEFEIVVRDTGIGMSQQFLATNLFKAFSQENSFTPGTGLGLSITSQIIRNMGGKIRVDSEKNVGTHVTITIPMEGAAAGSQVGSQEDFILDTVKATTGKRACFLNPLPKDAGITDEQREMLQNSISTVLRDWFGMVCTESKSVENDEDTNIFIYAEPPPIQYLVEQHCERKNEGKSGKDAALMVICTNAFEAAALRAAGIEELVSLGRIIEVVSQPVGPRKLAKVLGRCLERVEASGSATDDSSNSKAVSSSSSSSTSNEIQRRAVEPERTLSLSIRNQTANRLRPPLSGLRSESEPPLSNKKVDQGYQNQSSSRETDALSPTAIQHHITQAAGTPERRPYVLLVDDNAINLKLLVTFVKKIGLPYAEAVNGQEAVARYKEADQPFDFVLMDLQMPVMGGLEATRKIREFECEEAFTKPSTIIAITGVANEATREQTIVAGMSHFLTKPVRFKDLRLLLLE